MSQYITTDEPRIGRRRIAPHRRAARYGLGGAAIIWFRQSQQITKLRHETVWFYVVRFPDTGAFKIGISLNPRERMTSLRRYATSTSLTAARVPGRPIEVIAIIPVEERGLAPWLESRMGKGEGTRREFFHWLPPEVVQWARRTEVLNRATFAEVMVILDGLNWSPEAFHAQVGGPLTVAGTHHPFAEREVRP